MIRKLSPKFVERVWGVAALPPWFRLGEVWFENDSPLLVKFIFTTEKLSVQVHPAGPAGTGKTEMWHILKADPFASVAVGLREPVSKEAFRTACLDGSVEDLLSWVPVSPGDTIFVPAGTVHAIGAGITLCEIQQNSDITYRLYDYGRPRELHLEQGLAVATLDRHPGISTPNGARVAECEHFIADRVSIGDRTLVQPGFVIALDGEGTLADHAVSAGDVWLTDEPVELTGNFEVLLAYVPS
ncbi:MAG: class I mannose-6-phosphate isomerase [Bryobacteraceae bacterium]|nr:class I mannose-6-phosphate isomerase [Bryobacteraceae bacterium]